MGCVCEISRFGYLRNCLMATRSIGLSHMHRLVCLLNEDLTKQKMKVKAFQKKKQLRITIQTKSGIVNSSPEYDSGKKCNFIHHLDDAFI